MQMCRKIEYRIFTKLYVLDTTDYEYVIFSWTSARLFPCVVLKSVKQIEILSQNLVWWLELINKKK